MQNTTTFLRLTYCGELLTVAILAAIFETDMLPVGTIAIEETQEYVFSLCSVISTLISIPLALKLMTFKRVHALVQQSEQHYRTWALLRIVLLSVPLIYNTLMYYLLGFNTSCGYMALICVVSFFFIWPSDGKMRYERESFGNQEES